jgi:hypothetical protein
MREFLDSFKLPEDEVDHERYVLYTGNGRGKLMLRVRSEGSEVLFRCNCVSVIK